MRSIDIANMAKLSPKLSLKNVVIFEDNRHLVQMQCRFINFKCVS